MLSPTEILELLPVAQNEIAATERVFSAVYGDFPPEHFQRGIAEGWLKATDIAKDGLKAYRLIWQINAPGSIHFVALDYIGNGKINPDYRVWQRGAELIAQRENCTELTFSVRLRGVAEMCRKWGAVPIAISMRKTLKPAIDTREINHEEHLEHI
jgi:hypothetical protein